MKLFRKLAAAALAGVMALSLLTGCALGDAAKENAMLKALQTVGNMYDSVDGVKVSEDKDLSKKAHSVFSAFKAAEGDAWKAENPDDENLNMFIAKVTYKEIPYIVAVTKMPKNAKDSINWGYAAARIFEGFDGYRCIEWDNEDKTSGKLKVGFDVMNDAKLTDTQEKAEDYMVVFAKLPDSGTGSGSHAWSFSDALIFSNKEAAPRGRPLRGAAAFSAFLLLEAGHEVVGFDGLGGKAVVVPPAGEGGGDGEAAGNELFQLGALDGQDGLAHGAEDLIGQGQSQRSGAGQSGCRDVVMGHRKYLSF